MKPEEIINEFRQLLKNISNFEKNEEQEIFKFFSTQLVEDTVDDFFEAIITDPLLAEYAEKSFLIPVWEKVLDDNLIPIGIDIYAKKLSKVSSFHVAIGFYLYDKVDGKNLGSEYSQYYLSLGIRYKSFQCTRLKLLHLRQLYRLNRSYNLLNEILQVASSRFDYLASGYLLYAQTCWEYSNLDNLLPLPGLIALYIARDLESISHNELHNGYVGHQISFNNIYGVHDIIDAYIESQSINSEQKIKAQEIAYQFLRH